jgi:patatin-like phospholipase/acyl hydrolase
MMKPFRKNVAIAIDGGGIRGLIPARALMILEETLGKTSHDMFRLSVGTSTGSILAAGIACGLSAEQLYRLYLDHGKDIFKQTLRSRFWFSSRFRYPRTSLEQALRENMGDITLGELWKQEPLPTSDPFDLIETPPSS